MDPEAAPSFLLRQHVSTMLTRVALRVTVSTVMIPEAPLTDKHAPIDAAAWRPKLLKDQ